MDQPTVWHKLKHGDTVQLRGEDTSVRHATIDGFSEDRTVVWVRMRELNERKLVHCEDGVAIVPLNSPQQGETKEHPYACARS